MKNNICSVSQVNIGIDNIGILELPSVSLPFCHSRVILQLEIVTFMVKYGIKFILKKWIYLNVTEYRPLETDFLMFYSTVHHSIELLHQPTLMHSFLYSLTIHLLHYYHRHVASINMPIFRRKNCIHTSSGIFAVCKRLHSTLVERARSQPVYCAYVYRQRRYQMLCEYNFSS